MNLEKVVFGFFVLLAATLNFGFFIGDIDDPELHNPFELFAAWRCLVLSVRVPFERAQQRRTAPEDPRG